MQLAENAARRLANDDSHKWRRGTQGWYRTICPNHTDKTPSLGLKDGEFQLLIKCDGGCDQAGIREEIERAFNCSTVWALNDNEPQFVNNVIDLPVKEDATTAAWFDCIKEAYDYTDENGILLYQSCRLKGKKLFPQRRPNPAGGWLVGLGNCRRVLFRLPKVVEVAAEGGWIFLCEGEKDVINLERAGIDQFGCATTNPMGAGKWEETYTRSLEGVGCVYMLIDNDAAGEGHAALVAPQLTVAGIAVHVIRLPNLPEKGDVSDWLESGHSLEELIDFCTMSEVFAAPPTAATTTESKDEGEAKEKPENTKGFKLGVQMLGLGPSFDSDRANGVRLARFAKDILRYTPEALWLTYDDQRWVKDTKESVNAYAYAKQTADTIFQEANTMDPISAPLAGRLRRHAHSSQSSGALSSMLKMAQSEDELRASVLDFDKDKTLFNCKNTAVRVDDNSEVPHSPELLMMRMAGVNYDPNAGCEHWLKFIDEITCGDKEMARSLRIAVGYSFTGYTKERQCYIFDGDGGNGKSLFLSAVTKAAGDYAGNAQSSMFMKKNMRSQDDSLSQLKGLRIVTVSEINSGDRLDEALLKQITGGTDSITTRFLYGEPFTFFPECKLWFACNYMPQIRGTDDGIWSRIVVFPMRAKLKNIYGTEKTLEALFDKELPGILNWILAGAYEYLALGHVPISKSIESATRDYKETQDTIGRFLEECCICATNEAEAQFYTVRTRELYTAYKAWCLECGHSHKQEQNFKTDIIKRSFISYYKSSTAREYRGVKLIIH